MRPREALREIATRTFDPGECVLWPFGRNSQGYGQARIAGAMAYVHRFAYRVRVGPVPSGFELDHLCRERTCYNPLHLEPVTRRENIRRGASHVARQALLSGCPKCGGEYVVDPQGRRRCPPCRKAYAAVRWTDPEFRARQNERRRARRGGKP